MKKTFALLGTMLLIYSSFAQMHTRAEYFIDSDPGVGNGTEIVLSDTDNTILENFTIATHGLENGTHNLYVRTQDSSGLWSLAKSIGFYIQDTAIIPPVFQERLVVAAEYFVNTDPGVGKGMQIPVNPKGKIHGNFSISTSGLSNGLHRLYVRTQDNFGLWSLAKEMQFGVLPSQGGYPIAAFTADTVNAGETMSFTNLSDSITEQSTYTWDIFNDGTIDYNTKDISHIFDSTGFFPVKLTVTNDTLSTEFIGTVTVGNFNNISLSANGPLAFCEGDSVVLTAPENFNYLWNTGDTTQMLTAKTTGTYFVWLTDANGVTLPSNKLSVTVSQSFDAVVQIQDATVGMSNGFAEVKLVSGDQNMPDSYYLNGMPSSFKEGLMAYYPFNGNADDESGNGYHGTVNGPLLSTDRFGKLNSAFKLDGIDDNISIASPDLQLSNQITVSAWVNITESTNDHQVLISKWYNGNTQVRSFVFELQPNGQYIQFPIDGVSTDNISNASANTPIEFGKWVNLVGRYDGNTLSLFINGVKNTEFNFTGSIQSGATNLVLGAHEATNDRNTIKGSLDDVLIYNRALSDSEIEYLASYSNMPQQNIVASDYQLLWSTEATSTFVNDLAAGDYWVKTTRGQCSDSVAFTVNEITPAETDIVAAEYFIDTDPGVGNGTSLNVSNGAKIKFQESIAMDGISVGSHKLYVRTLANNGIWSLAKSMDFYIQDTTVDETITEEQFIVAAEYFVDTDPGVGNGTEIPVTLPVKNFKGTIDINQTDYSTGTHTLYVRVKSDNGIWSNYMSQEFQVCGILPATPLVENVNACYDGSTTLTATGTASNTFRWFAADSSLIANATTSTYELSNITENDRYFVAQVDANGCQSNLAQIDISVVEVDVFAGIDESLSKAGDAYLLEAFYPSEGSWTGSGINADGLINRNTLNATDYTMTYTVDSLSCAFSDQKTISILDLSEDFEITIDENPWNGTVLATGLLENIDSIQYISGPENAVAVSLDGTITVSDSSVFDFEINPSLTWKFNAVESPQFTHEINLTVTLVNGDDPPVIADQEFSIDENSTNGSIVGTIVATDQDSPTLLYTIESGNDAGTFALQNINELIVADSTALDYESDTAFYLTVSVTDGFQARTANISIFLNDLADSNSAPVVEDQTFEIEENSSNGTAVGIVIATDADDDALQYFITSGNETGAFALSETSAELIVADSTLLDFETLPTFSLNMEVTDGVDTVSAVITINLTDVDEGINSAPVVEDQTFEIEENSSNGSVVGIVIATDADDDALQYFITSGNESGAFALSETSAELTVANSTLLDFETMPTFSLNMEVTDGVDTVSAVITINLTDVDESINNAPVIENQTFTLAENSANGTLVGTIVASDADNDALTFAIISGNSSNTFALNTNTGELTVQDSILLDFETSPTFAFAVSVTDGMDTTIAEITITLTDVDEMLNTAPEILDQLFSIEENSEIGTSVGMVIATDEDEDVLSYRILSGNTDNAFAIINSTGELLVANLIALDYETTPIFEMEVEVSDETDSDTAIVTINLIDVDDGNSLLSQAVQFELFPNPAEDELIIKTDIGIQLITIYNSMGDKVLQTGTHSPFINTTELKSGLYIIQLQDYSNRYYLNRFIKK